MIDLGVAGARTCLAASTDGCCHNVTGRAVVDLSAPSHGELQSTKPFLCNKTLATKRFEVPALLLRGSADAVLAEEGHRANIGAFVVVAVCDCTFPDDFIT